jgi:aspartyl-tRNA(Asn)/glutamyl-tRNA(Gln) amidotransferase subunit B
MTPDKLAALVKMIDEDAISGKIGKDIFGDLFANGKDPASFVKERGLVQISDSSALESAVDEVLAESPEELAAYKAGKTKLMGFFVGQIMKKTKGQANPKLVNQILAKKLG